MTVALLPRPAAAPEPCTVDRLQAGDLLLALSDGPLTTPRLVRFVRGLTAACRSWVVYFDADDLCPPIVLPAGEPLVVEARP